MALPWFKVTSALVHHPKLAALEREIPVDGLGVLIRLWAWTAAYYPDGTIPAASAEPMAQEAIRGIEPEKDVTVTAAVTALVTAGFLDEIEGGYVVHDWSEMQGAHAVAAEKNREKQRRFRERNRYITEPGNRKVTLQSRGEEKRVDQDQLLAASAAKEPAASPPPPLALLPSESKPAPLLVFPCSGKKSDPREWGLTRAQVDEWSQAYPAVDVLGEARRILAWVNAKPERRKTARGWPAAFVRWLGGEQNKARGSAPAVRPVAVPPVLSSPVPSAADTAADQARREAEFKASRKLSPQEIQALVRDATPKGVQ